MQPSRPSRKTRQGKSRPPARDAAVEAAYEETTEVNDELIVELEPDGDAPGARKRWAVAAPENTRARDAAVASTYEDDSDEASPDLAGSALMGIATVAVVHEIVDSDDEPAEVMVVPVDLSVDIDEVDDDIYSLEETAEDHSDE